MGGGGRHGELARLAEEAASESAVVIDEDSPHSPQTSAWIDVVPVSDLAASLESYDSSAFDSTRKHLHQARALGQSLLSHYGSDSREHVMTQRFIRPLFALVLSPFTLNFTSPDADEAFGQLMLAESASKVIERNAVQPPLVSRLWPSGVGHVRAGILFTVR